MSKVHRLVNPANNLHYLSERLKMLAGMLDVSVDCIKVINPDGTLVFMNKSGCLALGVGEDETRFGMDWISLLPKSIHRRGRNALKKANEGESARFAGMSVQDGVTTYWDNMLTPVIEQGRVKSILCVSRNVTQQKVAEEKLRFTCEMDELTRLPNRRSMKKHLQRAITAARKKGSQVGLMLMDVDGFKAINDTLGHAGGDALLQQLAAAFESLTQDGLFFARLGGDEFAAVVDVSRGDAEMHGIAQMIRCRAGRVFEHEKIALPYSLSIGGAIFPSHAQDAAELMKHADMAMYHVKANGRDGFHLFRDRKASRLVSPYFSEGQQEQYLAAFPGL